MCPLCKTVSVVNIDLGHMDLCLKDIMFRNIPLDWTPYIALVTVQTDKGRM